MRLLGFDIGGTKCAVIVGKYKEGHITITSKQVLPTNLKMSPEEMVDSLCNIADGLLQGEKVDRVGVSCGGPLDSNTGRILGPPNLPGWDDVPIVKPVKEKYNVPVFLQNDANACALAEWKFGNGRGFQNIIFLTFGTGLGAGLILNGKLYTGASDMAGEAGHIRLERYGPVGYGKRGSFEGFCSGSGLAQIGYTLAVEAIQNGTRPLYFPEGTTADKLTARDIAEAARQGDKTALEVFQLCGSYLGAGLAVLIDILNPEAIIIGSVFARTEDLLRESMEMAIQREALPGAAKCCRVLPALLGESLGDYAALSTALQ
ncbi:MAG TPA: ROK family protein [Clostridiales bacterium]|nr:ROK family protein [Clostridiales bacterium]